MYAQLIVHFFPIKLHFYAHQHTLLLCLRSNTLTSFLISMYNLNLAYLVIGEGIRSTPTLGMHVEWVGESSEEAAGLAQHSRYTFHATSKAATVGFKS